MFRHPMNQHDVRHRLSIALALPLILLTLVALVFLSLIGYQRSITVQVERSNQVLARANRLQTLLADQESGLRGYLLTGEIDMLEPYVTAEASLDSAFSDLERLVGDNPLQAQRIVDLRADAAAWDSTASLLANTPAPGAAEQSLALQREGKRRMDALRRQLAAFIATETELRDQHSQRMDQAVQIVTISSVGLALLLGVVLITVTMRQVLAVVQSYGQALAAAGSQAEALQKSERRFRVLFDHAPLGIALVRDDRILMTNERFALIFGLTDSASMIGRSWITLVVPDARDKLLAWIEQQAYEVSSEPFDSVGLREDGASFPFSLQITHVVLPGGPAKVMYLIDRTEQQQLEHQVRQMQKLESVGRLAGSIAHDFNNLLTAMLGSADLARSAIPKESPAQHDLMTIEQAGERAARLTRQLLTFARKQTIAPQPLNLNDLIRAMEPLLHRLLGDSVDLITEAAPDLGLVMADEGQIEQVLLNLSVNARDAMPGGGKLTIETANVTLDEDYTRMHMRVKPGPYVMLAVSDTGIGIPPDVQARLFEPFFTTKGPDRGTGLGLATCYGIVTQHGGSIWVYSELGQGSTFKVYLPRVPLLTDQQVAPNTAGKQLPAAETVLLVEDNPAIREMASGILRNQGYTVLEAMSGDQAISMARQHPDMIHLLLTDVVLPHISGDVLAEQLRDTRPDIRVLFLSGYPDQALHRQQRLAAGVAVLHKPFAAAELLRVVRAALDQG